MELLYLWVEKYNNIEKQGFNFSSKCKFDYDDDKKELKGEENPNGVTDGFFGDNITNITAIIGKNGSGKSSVFDMIALLNTDWNSEKENAYNEMKSIIVLKKNNEFMCMYYLDEIIYTKFNIELYKLDKKLDRKDKMIFTGIFSHIKEKVNYNILIYSNLLNIGKRYGALTEQSNLKNISTDLLILLTKNEKI